VTSKSEAEAGIYDELRHHTDGLHANLVQRAIKRATDDINNCVDRLAEGQLPTSIGVGFRAATAVTGRSVDSPATGLVSDRGRLSRGQMRRGSVGSPDCL
jgi:hypothetical protein